jgi:hypothetical protein
LVSKALPPAKLLYLAAKPCRLVGARPSPFGRTPAWQRTAAHAGDADPANAFPIRPTITRPETVAASRVGGRCDANNDDDENDGNNAHGLTIFYSSPVNRAMLSSQRENPKSYYAALPC